MDRPQASVVIPTYNRARVLGRVLAGLDRQQGLEDGAFEIVVADDGSTDGTQALLEDFAGRTRFPLQVIRLPRGGPARARNAAVRRARAPVVIFIDSDLIPGPGLVAAHLQLHQSRGGPDGAQSRVIGHGPVIRTYSLEDPKSATSAADWSRAFFATGNASIAMWALERAGMFDERFVEYGWEDLELGLRLRRLGLEAVRVPGAAGYHYKPLPQEGPVERALEEVRRRERERGHTAVLFYRKHPVRRVRAMTAIHPVTFWLHRVLCAGGWTSGPGVEALARRLQAARRRQLLGALLWLAGFDAYVQGLREALSGDYAGPGGAAGPGEPGGSEGVEGLWGGGGWA